MTPACRAASAALGLAAGLAAVAALPAGAEEAGTAEPHEVPGFRVDWATTPGAAFDGDRITISGTVTPPPGTGDTMVTDIVLTLARLEEPGTDPDDRCPSSVTEHHLDGEQPGATTTTTPERGRRFDLDAVPACNGGYHVSVVAIVDRPDPAFDLQSAALHLGDPADPAAAILASLRPPDATVTGVVAEGRTVTVTWEPPSPIPPDLTGYLVQRSVGDSEFTTVAEVADPATQAHTDVLGSRSAAGTYSYQVLTARRGAAGQVVTSAGGTSIGEVAVGPPAGTPATTRPARAVPPVRRQPAPTVLGMVPPTTVDEGFSEALDYRDVELLQEAAEVPDDASSFLDFAPSPGAGILVPFAIAECLAVWAMHLRHLARRAEQL